MPPEMGMGLGGGARSAKPFSAVKAKIKAGLADVSIYVNTDSTGDATDEWPYLFATWLSTTYPTHTVKYQLWDDTGGAYGAATTIATGSGSRTITLYNCALAGTQLDYWAGAKFAASLGNLSPDVMIFSSGENSTAMLSNVTRGRFEAFVEQAMLSHPGVGVVVILQNPWRDTSDMDLVIDAWRHYCYQRGDFQIVDVYTQFMQAGKPVGWYKDSVHPNATGEAVYVAQLQLAWNTSPISSFTAPSAWLSKSVPNLLLNGDFSAFTGALPDNWSVNGNGVITKDTTIKAPGSAASVKIVNGSANTFIFQNLNAGGLAAVKAAGTATLAVKLYVVSGGNSNTGRVRFFTDQAGAVLVAANEGDTGNDGWRWIVIPDMQINSDAVNVGPFLYANPSNGLAGTVYYDRAVLIAGAIPHNM